MFFTSSLFFVNRIAPYQFIVLTMEVVLLLTYNEGPLRKYKWPDTITMHKKLSEKILFAYYTKSNINVINKLIKQLNF